MTFFLTAALVFFAQTGVSDDVTSKQQHDARLSVAENSPRGTTVGFVTARNPAGQSKFNFTITGGNAGEAFALNPETGEITVKDASRLNHEDRAQYVLQVGVRREASIEDSFDDGFAEELKKLGIDPEQDKQPLERQTVIIDVDDVNEGPVLAEGTLTVAEQSLPGTIVGRVMAADPDAGDRLQYLFNNDNAATPFRIDSSTGEIIVADQTALDFETRPRYDVDVVVIDDAGVAAEQTWRIDLTDVNEPPQVAGQSFNLPEGSAAGTFVGHVAASDPDHGDRLTYAITGGNDDGCLAIDPQSGEISVADSAGLDFEQASQRNLTVQVQDTHGAEAVAEVRIDLSNVNEPPTVAETKWTLPKAMKTGTVVGTMAAHDPDQADGLTYTITEGNDDNAFAIDPQSGKVTVASSDKLNARSKRRAALKIHVADQAGASAMATAHIDLGVAPASPSLAAAIHAIKAEEKQPAPMPVQKAAVETVPVKAEAATPVAATKVANVPQAPQRATAAWMLFCVGAGAFVWGGALVFASLRVRRLLKGQQQARAAIQRDEELLRERLVDVEDFSAELRAERDELMATRCLLTGEFEKLKTLLSTQSAELKSTDTALQLGDEILQHHAEMAGAVATSGSQGTVTSGRGETTLQSVRHEFAMQQQRLGTLQESMEQRDRELIETCAKMDARLEEVLQKTALIDHYEESQTDGDVGGTAVEDETDERLAVAAEWDARQAQIQELERQFDGDAGDHSPEGSATGANMVDKTMTSAVVDETGFEEEVVTDELKQKWAARSELNTLRAVANHSTRKVLANYSRKKMLKSKMLLGAMTLFGVSFALLALFGGLGAKAAQASLGWGALGTAGVALVLLLASFVQHRPKHK